MRRQFYCKTSHSCQLDSTAARRTDYSSSFLVRCRLCRVRFRNVSTHVPNKIVQSAPRSNHAANLFPRSPLLSSPLLSSPLLSSRHVQMDEGKSSIDSCSFLVLVVFASLGILISLVNKHLPVHSRVGWSCATKYCILRNHFTITLKWYILKDTNLVDKDR